MKHILFLLCFCGSLQLAVAQSKPDTLLPYQKHPELPAMQILRLDSSVFNTYSIAKGKPTILMFFSPDCDHCFMMAQSMLKKSDSLQGANIYMVALMELYAIRIFANKLPLAAHKNFVIGRDPYAMFPGFYGIKYVPYFAVYDKNKRLVKTFDGHATITELSKAAGLFKD